MSDIFKSCVSSQLNSNYFKKSEPTFIGKVGPFRFYEDPFNGDEAPLWVTDGVEFGISYFWNLPHIFEIEDLA